MLGGFCIFHQENARVAQGIARAQRPNVVDIQQAIGLRSKLLNNVAGIDVVNKFRVEAARRERRLQRKTRNNIGVVHGIAQHTTQLVNV